jgi:hypothetical protein
MDFVTIWKASSILLTGAFGILGLLTEFKEKETKRITKWGRVSLLGIVVTTTLGFVAQLKQSVDDAHKALLLSKKSDETLTSIERALSPLDGSSLTIDFETDCSKTLAGLCKQVEVYTRTRQTASKLADVLKRHGGLHYSAAVFAKREDVEAERTPAGMSPNLVFNGFDSDVSVDYSQFGNSLQTLMQDHNPQFLVNDGTIRSIRDLPGKYLVIDGEIAGIPERLQPMRLSIDSKIGEVVFCDRFDKIYVRSEDSEFFFCQLNLERASGPRAVHP